MTSITDIREMKARIIAFFRMTEQALPRLGEGLRARREQPALTSAPET